MRYTSPASPRSAVTILTIIFSLFIAPLWSLAAVRVKPALPAAKSAVSPAALFVERQPEQAALNPSSVSAPLPQPTPNAPAVVAITATMTDSFTDADADGKAEPGETITYTATINETGGTDATGVMFNIPSFDANTNFVAGSAHASPIAANEAYTTVGNTLLEAGVAASGNPAVTSTVKLFDNDTISTGPDTIQLQTFQATSANGGTVAVNADGSFTYLPATGFTGTDTFTYTIRNSAVNSLQGTGTVTITVSNKVWYVRNNAGGGGTGRSNSPFNTLLAAQTASAVNDVIYVHTGDGTTTGQNAGITLKNGQLLIGQGVALIVGGFTLNAAGTRPNIAGGGASGVNLAQNNTVRGLDIGNSTPGLFGNNFGTLTLDTVSVNSNNTAVNLTTGTANATFTSVSSSGSTVNVNLSSVAGTVDLGTGALSGATSQSLFMNQGTAVVTYAGTITVNTGRPVEITSKTGGSVTLSGLVSTAAAQTSFGALLTGNTGSTITFSGGLQLNTGGNAAFTATGGGTVNVTQNNTTIFNTLTTTSGTALNVANTTIGASGLTFRSISSNGGSSGIILDTTGSTGAFTVTGNGGVCTNTTPNCTGGTIQNLTGSGISLTSTTNVSLNLMRVLNVASVESGTCDDLDVSGCRGALKMTGTVASPVTTTSLKNVLFSGSGEEGITGFNVRGFKIEDSEVRGFGQVVNENGIHILNLSDTATGQNLIEDTIVDGLATATPCASAAVHIRNTGTTSMSELAVRRVTMKGTEDGIRMTVRDSSNSSFIVTNNTFPGRLLGDGIDLAVGNSGDTAPIGNIVAQNNTLQNSGFGFGGIVLATTEHGRGTWTVRDNTISNNGGTAISIGPWSKFNTTTAVVARNNIDCPGGDGTIPGNTSGANPCRVGIGISISKEDGGGAGENGVAQVFLDSNTVNRAPEMINAITRTGTSAAGRLDLRVKGNIFTNNTGNPAIFDESNQFLAGSSGGPTGTFCLNMLTGNTPPAGSNNSAQGTSGADAYRLLERVGATFLLQGGVNGSNAAAIDTLVTASNTGTVFVASGTYDGGTCTTPTEIGPVSIPNPVDEVSSHPISPTSGETVSTSDRPFVSLPPQPKQASLSTAPALTATTSRIQTRTARTAGPNAPAANLPVSIGPLPANKSVTIQFQVTVDPVASLTTGTTQVSNQGAVSGSNFAAVLTDEVAGNPVTATVTPIDLASFSISDVRIAEGATGNRTVTFTVSANQTTNGATSVHYQTANNTATAPDDYTTVGDTTLNIPANTPSATFTVQVKGDTVFEGNENFFVNLSTPSGNAAILDSQGIVTIMDDEPQVGDFVGSGPSDGLTDAVVWNGNNGNWLIRNSNGGAITLAATDWGRLALGDVAVPGDYDFDNKIDIAIFRPSEGNWYILQSSTGTPSIQYWGQTGDVTVPGDYDADGRTDLAVYRPSEGKWYVKKSAGGTIVQNWGISTDKPVAGDYDGDGKSDLAVFRPAEGNWYIINSSSGTITITNWGVSSDKLAQGDYDGDGRTDSAVYRSGTWFIKNSSGGSTVKSWGNPTDLAVPGDYDGDGKFDIAVWRPAEGKWYVLNSATNTVSVLTIELGGAGIVPLPNAYLPQ